MKKLRLKNAHYEQYQKGFGSWLQTIGMSKGAQYYLPLHVRELLFFMTQRNIHVIQNIDVKDIKDYFAHLDTRPNQRRDGGLSAAHYNKHIQAVKKFSDYLWHHYKIFLPIEIKRKVSNHKYPVVLSEEEIAALYDATTYNRTLQLRDQVMLDLLYGCGLRRSEATQLWVEHISSENRMLYIRKGKNYSTRYVPFTQKMGERIKEYITWCRQDFLGGVALKTLLISSRGKAMQGQSMRLRLKQLCNHAEMRSLREKDPGLHTLRHSIATPLLHKGLPLVQIAQFLGHKSIESTQIYTHLSHQIWAQKK